MILGSGITENGPLGFLIQSTHASPEHDPDMRHELESRSEPMIIGRHFKAQTAAINSFLVKNMAGNCSSMPFGVFHFAILQLSLEFVGEDQLEHW